MLDAFQICLICVGEHEDDWETALVPLLRGDSRNGIPSVLRCTEAPASCADDAYVAAVEDRVIAMSVHVLNERGLRCAASLLQVLAIFPEEVAIPSSVFDTLCIEQMEPMKSALMESPISPRGHPVRKWLLQLLNHSLLQGSIRSGVILHGLVKMYAVSAVGEAVLLAMQRQAVKALLSALCKCRPGSTLLRYAHAHLDYHVSGAALLNEESEALSNPLLEALTEQQDPLIRSSLARAAGVPAVVRAAKRAEAQQNWLLAGRMYEAAAVLPGGDASGLHKAQRVLQRLETVSPASAELLASVARGLLFRKGGIRIDSTEHSELNDLLVQLHVETI